MSPDRASKRSEKVGNIPQPARNGGRHPEQKPVLFLGASLASFSRLPRPSGRRAPHDRRRTMCHTGLCRSHGSGRGTSSRCGHARHRPPPPIGRSDWRRVPCRPRMRHGGSVSRAETRGRAVSVPSARPRTRRRSRGSGAPDDDYSGGSSRRVLQQLPPPPPTSRCVRARTVHRRKFRLGEFSRPSPRARRPPRRRVRAPRP